MKEEEILSWQEPKFCTVDGKPLEDVNPTSPRYGYITGKPMRILQCSYGVQFHDTWEQDPLDEESWKKL